MQMSNVGQIQENEMPKQSGNECLRERMKAVCSLCADACRGMAQ